MGSLPLISGKILATLLQGNTLVDKRKEFIWIHFIVKLIILIYLCIILFPGQTCGYIVQPDNGAGYVQDNVRPLDPCCARQWPVGTRVRFACLEGYERQGTFEMSCVATGNSVNWDAQTPRCNLSESLNSKICIFNMEINNIYFQHLFLFL